MQVLFYTDFNVQTNVYLPFKTLFLDDIELGE